jgi:IclR family acetate operon transcriptional repressor
MRIKVQQKKKASSAERKSAAPRSERYFNRAVGKAFSVLQILARSEEPLTLSKIASQIELTKSSAFRLLYTLQELRYVSQDADGRYSVTEENRQDGYHSVAGIVVPLAGEVMQTLHQRFKETVSMAVLLNNHIEVAAVLESPHVVRMANTVGRILPPHASSLGKAITAFQPDSVARKLIVSYGLHVLTPSTITDELKLAEEMQRIRKQGFAFEMEESVPNGCCFGCPVFLDKTSAVASISISMPTVRLVQNEERRLLTEALKNAGADVSKKLRHATRYSG